MVVTLTLAWYDGVWTAISNDVDDVPRETDRTLPCGVHESCRMHRYRWVRVAACLAS